MTHFTDLGLEPRLLKALAQEGYETPTPIQAQAIPQVLKGEDLLGIAQTGTGKTAAFALPILQYLAANPRPPRSKTARALILSPTRELATQIADSFRAYGRFMNLSVTTIFGGVGEQPQVQVMKRGIDILVATPGRLLDHVRMRTVDLGATEVFVLDEADRMLDMGFINDIRKLIQNLPRERQNLFFSATMPKEIASLADDMLKNPVRVAVTPQATTVERIDQRVIFVDTADKRALLAELLRSEKDMGLTLVFTRTKHGADKVVRHLNTSGLAAAAIHGNKSQSQRVATMNAFRAGRTRVLIATDIAARGIDVDGITHVVNFDLPHVPESYVHRIGRTARAGAAGVAISFCAGDERPLLRDIEKVTRQSIPSIDRRGHRPARQPDAAPAQAVQTAEVAPQRHASGGFDPRKQRPHGKPRRHGKPKPRHGGGEQAHAANGNGHHHAKPKRDGERAHAQNKAKPSAHGHHRPEEKRHAAPTHHSGLPRFLTRQPRSA